MIIPVLNGLSTRTNVKLAKLDLQEAEIAEQEVRDTFTKVISLALQDLTAAESNYKSAQGAFNATKDAFRVIELRNNVGLSTALEFNQPQSDRNIAELNVIQSRYDFLFKATVIDYYLGLPLVF